MSDVFRHCDNCGEEIHRFTAKGRIGRFCTKKCRDQYHNALKKIPRSLDVVTHEISFMLDSMLTSGELANEAFEAMRKITAMSLDNRFQFTCLNCGQKRLEPPQKGEKCAFCGDSNWQVKILGRSQK